MTNITTEFTSHAAGCHVCVTGALCRQGTELLAIATPDPIPGSLKPDAVRVLALLEQAADRTLGTRSIARRMARQPLSLVALLAEMRQLGLVEIAKQEGSDPRSRIAWSTTPADRVYRLSLALAVPSLAQRPHRHS